MPNHRDPCELPEILRDGGPRLSGDDFGGNWCGALIGPIFIQHITSSDMGDQIGSPLHVFDMSNLLIEGTVITRIDRVTSLKTHLRS